MSSAHYQALEPQTSDEDHEDIERQPHRSVPYTMGRKGSVSAGRRRCLLLAGAVIFIVAFCYLTFSMDTRLALGLGGGSDDSDEHHGLDSINFRPLNETLHICSESYEDRRLFMQDKPRSEYEKLPVIYFVTPTYPRREQIPELTRLAHTLLHVPRLHWLVADDQENCNTYLDTLLNRFGIPFTHMVSPMPSKFRNEKPAPRGVANRRAALQWLKTHNLTNGVLYFGDDDNTYDLRLFSEIRKTQIVSMFPVGLIADYGISGPVVRKGKVVAFLDSWIAGRRWPVDMAGFAVNLEYMAKYPYVNMPYKPGYEEDLFLRSIGLRMDLIEPRGNNCTEVLVWHTQTKSKKIGTLRMESKYMDDRSNLGALLHNLKTMGVALISEDEGRTALISKNGKEKPHSLILS
ncbi:galactosylgalactosylxylosylprotein 3-beta-glucuronosyltransferase S isoform X2 [Drosophila bipectinata]|uniref:galactosylgalactosylxylosylprotein 3-beta-glucuronosyltransferase S isoform X2 n=1 Tax=Drosophila bipectinata TaxID=42026 RepID=UPI0007E6348E|nr:galactosylgalactosylxylosylprotein 3-beta-glucuronosyltransferase S isoform X1 [Drosophila bipectinata]